MILLTILTITLIFLVIFTVIVAGLAGAVGLIVFGDVIICIGVLGIIIRYLIIRKRNKNEEGS